MLTSPLRSPACGLRRRRRCSSILFISSPYSLPCPPGFPLIVFFASFPVVFMSESELVLGLVKVLIDALRFHHEITVTLGIRFRRPRLEEGEPGLSCYLFLDCSVCINYNVKAGDHFLNLTFKMLNFCDSCTFLDCHRA